MSAPAPSDFPLAPASATNSANAESSSNSPAEIPSKDTLPEEASATPEKRNVTGDDLYRRLSQYQMWSFNTEELAKLKAQANEKGRLAALQRFEAVHAVLKAEKPDVFAAFGDRLGLDSLELISLDEEQRYLHFFGQQIVQICSHFNMPTQVRATAVSFFKKFYLVNSVMEYRPRNVLYTAVFLAAKLENYFISTESFCLRLPKTKPEDILGLEYVILLSLKFTLLVHHPYRPLYGFFLDFQLVLLHPQPVMYDVNIDTIGKLYDKSKLWLNDRALLSDVSFLFTPPQIALAALYDLDKKVTDRYLKIKFADGPEGSAAKYDAIVKTIRSCIDLAKQETATTREESTKTDEKCFFTLNPQKFLKKRIKALQDTASAS